MSDDLTAILAGIKERRASRAEHAPGMGAPAAEFDLLVAAVEAVLKLADEWDAEFARLEPSGADATGRAMPGNYLVSGRTGALEDCAQALRAAITRELSGKDGTKGEGTGDG
jgi:hypothetical protein